MVRGRRCLVLGASGFIGGWVGHVLHALGARVVAHVRDRSRLPIALESAAERVHVTALAPGAGIRDLLRSTSPDLVFDLVGYGVAKSERDPDGYRTINRVLPVDLARAVGSELGTSAVLVRVGSALEVGPSARSLDESAPSRPTTAYGKSKLAATLAVDGLRDEGVAALTARAFTVFGPGERPGRLVPTLLAAAETDEPIPLSDGHQRRDWCYAEDVARALVDLACGDPDSIRRRRPPYDAPCVNLACGSLTSVREFVDIFAEEFGIRTERLRFGDIEGLPEEMPHPPVPVDRLAAAIGWVPPEDPRVGIRRMKRHLEEKAP